MGTSLPCLASAAVWGRRLSEFHQLLPFPARALPGRLRRDWSGARGWEGKRELRGTLSLGGGWSKAGGLGGATLEDNAC